MRLFTLALLLLALMAGTAFASDDYRFDGTHYWLNGRAYTRTYYTRWNPYYCRYEYVYAYHAVAVERPAVKLSYLDPSWRSKMLELTAQKIEQQAFMDSAKALGLTVADPEAALYSRFVPTGATIYGTSFQALQQAWGLDPTVENMAQSYRLAEQAQASAEKGRDGHQLLIGQTAAARERVASILAKATAASDILKAIEGVATRSETKGYSFRVEPAPVGGLKVERQDDAVAPAVRANLAAQWQTVAKQDCAGCHSGDKPKGGFRVEDYPRLEMRAKVAVWERLVHPDEGKRMPRKEDGSAGARIGPERLQVWILN